MSERKRTTRLERAELGRDIDERTAQLHTELDALLTQDMSPEERTERLDAVSDKLDTLTLDIDNLQRITREDRSWG